MALLDCDRIIGAAQSLELHAENQAPFILSGRGKISQLAKQCRIFQLLVNK